MLYRFILLNRSSISQSSLGVDEPTVLEASEEERVVAEEEEAVRHCELRARAFPVARAFDESLQK